MAVCEDLGERLDWAVHAWSAASGVDGSGRHRELSGLLAGLLEGGTRGGTEGGYEGEAVWVLFDVELSGPEGGIDRRRLRELAQRSDGPALILVAAPGARVLSILATVPELGHEHLALPSAELLAARAEWAAAQLSPERPEFSAGLRAEASTLGRAGVGLELASFDRLLAEAALAIPDQGGLAGFLSQRKAQALAEHGLLELCEPVPAGELGGLDTYVAWLRRRALALNPEARLAGIPAPRGALLVGVQGCGKSLAARVSADILGLPLLRLDLGRLFGGTVGESEANARRALATVERMAPAVLWIDEIDKGLGGVRGDSDGGTAGRVVGGLLTWLQEREQAVFVVATANQVDRLPPELLRRGRLDELFFVDLPSAEQRAAILAIHLGDKPLRRFGVTPPLDDPPASFLALARAAEGFSGAELEAALIEARLEAFARSAPLGAGDFERALAQTVPLSRVRAESIATLRTWAKTGARSA